MEHLAGVLRSLREDAAITQEELADRAGLSVRTVSDIERGLRRRLYEDTAERLAAALGLDGRAREDFVELARGRAVGIQRDLDAGFRRRFVAWHVDRVSALADHVGHEEQWYAVLDADEPNLSVALRWAAEAGNTEALHRRGADRTGHGRRSARRTGACCGAGRRSGASARVICRTRPSGGASPG